MCQKSHFSMIAAAALFITIASLSNTASAQVVIQLPTIDTFNVNTTVMVPDGGQMLLGGVRRGSFGRVERGVPGMSNLPGVNRLFKNRGIGQEIGSSTATVKPRIIIMSEIESQVMSEANQRAERRIAENENLRPKTVKQARFLSRNIGKKKKHR